MRALPRPLDLSDQPQHLLLENASWELYEKLLRNIGNRPLRVTYDDGWLEVISPSLEHERTKGIIGRMIAMLAFESHRPMLSLGSTTFRLRDISKGLDPDECYYFRHEAQMRRRKRLNLHRDPPPELVVDADITNRCVPREPICAALGIPEIWRYDGLKLQCLHLVGGKYLERKRSLVFPLLEPALLRRFVHELMRKDDTAIIRTFIAWVRKQGWMSAM